MCPHGSGLDLIVFMMTRYPSCTALSLASGSQKCSMYFNSFLMA